MGKIDDTNNDALYFIAICLILMQDNMFSDLWDKFEDDIINHNRFFQNNEIIDEINGYMDKAIIYMPKGTNLFRARIYDRSLKERYIECYKNVLEQHGKVFDEKKLIKEGLDDTYISMLRFADEKKISDDEDLKLKVEAYKKYKNLKFKGYDAIESLPPTEGISSGRANPDNIRYLYVCEDKVTPIYEVKPSIGQTVSLAKLKLKRDVKLFDFTFNPYSESDVIPKLFTSIGYKFSLPNYGRTTKYYATQYLAEMIKHNKFDGIRFNSSLNKDGKNIVLFNVDDCSVISSKLVEISKINIKTKPLDM
jgi:hypothetical protein